MVGGFDDLVLLLYIVHDVTAEKTLAYGLLVLAVLVAIWILDR